MYEELEGLRTENAGLRARVAELEARERESEAVILKLREEIAGLREVLERVRREGKRQAAPFRKADGPRPEPKRPGRKSGPRHGKHAHRSAPAPEAIDEEHEAILPDCCPHCGSRDLEEIEVVPQYQTEIPRRPIRRRFNVHRGKCQCCGQPLQGRHELQTSDALGAAGSQLGPAAHATMTVLNKELGLSHGKVSRCFKQIFGIEVARATSARSLERTATRCEPDYAAIRSVIREASQVVPDETGWRVGGRSAWLHVVVSESATCYEVAPGRGHEVLEGVLGRDWSGTMVHDGTNIYDVFQEASHQQCLKHLADRCEEVIETATGGAVRFPRQVLELVDVAFQTRRDYEAGNLDEDRMVEQGLALACNLEELASGRFRYEPNRRLAKHLLKHAIQWFWFLIHPDIDATNYRAEQAIRPAVVNRKVWGGNRTWIGARAQSVLTSVVRTCIQRGRDTLDYLMQTLCSPRPRPLLLLGGKQ